MALDFRNMRIARLLCSKGAYVNAAPPGDGLTALMLVARDGFLEGAKFLCEEYRGVSRLEVNGADARGRIALMYALGGSVLPYPVGSPSSVSIDVACVLCAHGADVNVATKETRTTALMDNTPIDHLAVVLHVGKNALLYPLIFLVKSSILLASKK